MAWCGNLMAMVGLWSNDPWYTVRVAGPGEGLRGTQWVEGRAVPG